MENLLTELAKIFPALDAHILAGTLIFARMLAFMVFAPVFHQKEIPTMVKISLALILTISLTMIIGTVEPAKDVSMVVSIVLNATVGVMIAFMARLILIAVDSGADLINMQMGLSSAMVLDPSSQQQVSIIQKLFSIMALLIFIQVGGIYWLFQAFLRSFEVFPIYGTSIPLMKVVNFDYLIQMTSNVLYMGLQIASPVLLATLGQDIILGVISKVAPQVNVFQLSFLFKPVFGAAILIWILPMLINIITDYYLSFSHIL